MIDRLGFNCEIMEEKQKRKSSYKEFPLDYLLGARWDSNP